MAYTLVDELSALVSLLESLDSLPHSPPSLFVDLEGERTLSSNFLQRQCEP